MSGFLVDVWRRRGGQTPFTSSDLLLTSSCSSNTIHPPTPSFNLTHPLPIPLFHRRTTTLHSTRNNCFCLEGVQGGGKGGALGSLCEEKGVFEGQLVNSPLSSFSSPSLYSSSIITASYCFLSPFFIKKSPPFSPAPPFSPLFLTGPADVICHV